MPINFMAGAGVEDLDLQPEARGSRLHISQRGFGMQGPSD